MSVLGHDPGGRRRSRPQRAHCAALRGGRAIRRQVPGHRLCALELRQFGHLQRRGADAVPAALAQRAHRARAGPGTSTGRPAACACSSRTEHERSARGRVAGRDGGRGPLQPGPDPRSIDEVLVLPGDHIYKMDYNPLLRFHRERGADVTIATSPCPTTRRTGLAWSAPTRSGG